MSSRSRVRERRQKAKQRRRLYWILGIAAAGIAVAAILILPSLGGPGGITAPDPIDWPQSSGTTLGDPAAPVTIVEYSDFQCPFCRQFHEETFPLLLDNHIRTGEVQFIYRNFPIIGRESLEAGNAALCAAEQDAFWPYINYLFANQTGENVGAYSEARLQAIAQELGLDMDPFEQCSSRNEMQDRVQSEYAQGLEVGVNSTPTLVVNGKVLPGALPYSQLQGEIQSALAEAE